MTVNDMKTRAERLMRSPLLSAGLILTAGVFIAFRWRSTDWTALATAKIGWLLLGGLAYAAALLALPIAATGGPDRRIWRAAFEAQLHKYVPGSVWQAQPLVAVGGLRLALRVGWATILTAAIAIAANVQGWVLVATSIALVCLIAVSGARLGWRFTAKGVFWAGVAALLMITSGALVAVGLGMDFVSVGRAVGAAWGFGVLAVPVPSGIGIREASMTLLLSEQGPPVAAAHRLLTLVVDVVVGSSAVLLGRCGNGSRSEAG